MRKLGQELTTTGAEAGEANSVDRQRAEHRHIGKEPKLTV